jgi:hypothetical protein
MRDIKYGNVEFGDTGDSYAVNDPVLTDKNIEAVIRLQERYDEIQVEKDPDKRIALAKKLFDQLGDVSL